VYERLPATLRTRSIGRVIREFDSVDSTNNIARLLLEESNNKIQDGTVFIAREQSAGRGRWGHTWYSPRDAGLYFSIILRPDRKGCAPLDSPMGFFPLAIGLAVARMLCRHYGLDALIKWPNDILIEGRKVCGILVERLKVDTYLIGIGLNSNWTPQILHEVEKITKQSVGAHPGILCIQPSALSLELGECLDHSVLLGRLLESLDVAYTVLLRKLYASVLSRVRRRLFGLGRAVIFTQGRYVRGIFEGINGDGHALVRCEDGAVQAVQSGEVYFADRD